MQKKRKENHKLNRCTEEPKRKRKIKVTEKVRWSKSLCVQEACDMVMSIVKRHVCTNVNIQKKETLCSQKKHQKGIKKVTREHLHGQTTNKQLMNANLNNLFTLFA